jgi:hypothetical protein
VLVVVLCNSKNGWMVEVVGFDCRGEIVPTTGATANGATGF